MTALPRSEIKPNPEGWRWALIKLLWPHPIEVIPLFPRRPVYDTEVVLVRLGEPGGYNTAEVKTSLASVGELIPMESVYHDPIPNTFIAIDLKETVEAETDVPRRVVGTFLGWRNALGRRVMLLEKAGGETAEVRYDWIEKAYWAPAGYRP